MKYTLSLLILFLCILPSSAYEINGNIVYIDNSKVFMSAYPHTLDNDGYVTFELESKQYSGLIDIYWGFDSLSAKPISVEYWNDDNWIDISHLFKQKRFDWDNKDLWYYIEDFNINTNQIYTIRAYIDISDVSVGGKYDWVVKPSSQTFIEAKNDNNLFILDPWWNGNYGYRMFLNINNTGGGVLINHPVYLNLSASDITGEQPDFDDIRYINVSDQTELFYGTKKVVNGTYAEFWINVTYLSDGWNNYTVVMYWGNSDVTSNSDFRNIGLDGDGFSGEALDTDIWNDQHCNIVVADGILTVDTFVDTGGRFAAGLLGKRLISSPFIVESRFKNVNANDFGSIGLSDQWNDIADDSTRLALIHTNLMWIYTYNEGVASTAGPDAWTPNQWYDLKLTHNGSAVHGYYDGTEITNSPSTTNIPDEDMYMRVLGDPNNSPTIKLDYIFVREYIPVEPTVYLSPQIEYHKYSGVFTVLDHGLILIRSILNEILSIIPLLISLIIALILFLGGAFIVNKLKRW